MFEIDFSFDVYALQTPFGATNRRSELRLLPRLFVPSTQWRRDSGRSFNIPTERNQMWSNRRRIGKSFPKITVVS